jgi:hypothetical protein
VDPPQGVVSPGTLADLQLTKQQDLAAGDLTELLTGMMLTSGKRRKRSVVLMSPTEVMEYMVVKCGCDGACAETRIVLEVLCSYIMLRDGD